MTRTKKHFVFAAVTVKKCETRRIAVHDIPRQIERLAKSRAQPGCADPFRTDDCVFLENERFYSRSCCFSRSRTARRARAHYEKFDRFHPRMLRDKCHRGPFEQ